MAVITESMLRSEFRNNKIEKYHINSRDLVTPSAKEFLKEKGIEIILGDLEEVKVEVKSKSQDKKEEVSAPKHKYICEETGAYFENKPEHMTQLYGNNIVSKDHKRIVFRGKLDSFIAMLLEYQSRIEKQKAFGDIEEIVSFSRQILISEFTDALLQEIKVFDLTDSELREHSHNPKKYYGVGHLFNIGSENKTLTILLNVLRSKSREVEIYGVKALMDHGKVQREDILRGLNRLSSCIYIMMLKSEGGLYE